MSEAFKVTQCVCLRQAPDAWLLLDTVPKYLLWRVVGTKARFSEVRAITNNPSCTGTVARSACVRACSERLQRLLRDALQYGHILSVCSVLIVPGCRRLKVLLDPGQGWLASETLTECSSSRHQAGWCTKQASCGWGSMGSYDSPSIARKAPNRVLPATVGDGVCAKLCTYQAVAALTAPCNTHWHCQPPHLITVCTAHACHQWTDTSDTWALLPCLSLWLGHSNVT